MLLLALGRTVIGLIEVLYFKEFLGINVFPDPFGELNQGFRSVPMERRGTLGVLYPQTEGGDSNSLIEIIHLEVFLVELVNKFLERLTLLLSDS